MIVVDTSALVAIVFGEAERVAFLEVIRKARTAWLSSVSVVEARMVVHGRLGQPGVLMLDDLIRLPMFAIAAPAEEEAAAAYAAFVNYGKGSGHKAQLNFGDVFSYALAKVRGLPLLFKGDDFAQTDIIRALAARSR